MVAGGGGLLLLEGAKRGQEHEGVCGWCWCEEGGGGEEVVVELGQRCFKSSSGPRTQCAGVGDNCGVFSHLYWGDGRRQEGGEGGMRVKERDGRTGGHCTLTRLLLGGFFVFHIHFFRHLPPDTQEQQSAAHLSRTILSVLCTCACVCLRENCAGRHFFPLSLPYHCPPASCPVRC